MEIEIEDNIRELLRQFIAKEYVSQTKFANIAGVSVQYISNILNGNKPVPPWLVKRYLGYEAIEPEPQPIRFRKIKYENK